MQAMSAQQMVKCSCGQLMMKCYWPVHQCPKPRKMVDGDLYAYNNIRENKVALPDQTPEGKDTCEHNWTKHFTPGGFSHYECSKCGAKGNEIKPPQEIQNP